MLTDKELKNIQEAITLLTNIKEYTLCEKERLYELYDEGITLEDINNRIQELTYIHNKLKKEVK